MSRRRAVEREIPVKSQTAARADSPARIDAAIMIGIVLAVFAAYVQGLRFDFVQYDDPLYVTANPHVTAGLTGENLKWAITSVVDANWVPVTNLSHMLDCQFFGLDSGMHHLINTIIHALAASLLFAALNRATRMRWPSAFVAFMFALHPLHVESVAWIAERKDVLGAFFWFLALYAYVRYTERPSLRGYLLVTAAMCLGLMSKPMLVTFPFTLLLFDVWPLRRARFPQVIWEKLPFFALSAAISLVTYFTQRSGGAMKGLPLELRLENAVISYAVYLRKTFWPLDLAVFYPYPHSFPLWQFLVSLAVVAGISALAMILWRTRPYFAAGWLWYLGTLIPVLGIVQVGFQPRADRYTYIPITGLAIMLAWGAADAIQRWPHARKAITAVGIAFCIACFGLTCLQAGYWKNSEELFGRALSVTNDNDTMEFDLGSYLMSMPGRAPDAIAHLRAALRINPDFALAHDDLGAVLGNQPGHLEDAIAEFRTAIRCDPKFAGAHHNLAKALASTPNALEEALREYQTALQLDPNDPETHFDFGNTLSRIPGRSSDALAHYQTALKLNPDYTDAQQALRASIPADPAQAASTLAPLEAKVRENPHSAEAHEALALALARIPGRAADAIGEFETALRLRPDFAEAHFTYGLALSRMPGRERDAQAQYESAVRLKPDYPEAHNNLGVLLVNLGRVDEAITHFRAATKLRPDYQNQRNLGIMLSKRTGQEPEALAHLQAAQRMHPSPDIDAIIKRLQSGQH